MALMTLDGLLRSCAQRWHDKPCLKTAEFGVTMSYQELDWQATAFATALLRNGCCPGDCVLLAFGNSPGFFAALFGCFRAGLVAVPVDPMLAPGELQAIVDHARPVQILVPEESEAVFHPLQRFGGMTVLDAETTLCGLLLDPVDGCPDDATLQDNPDQPALLLYTSGTTGRPKGVLYSHSMLLAKIEAIRRWFSFDESFRTLCLLPTHFGHGLICNCLSVFGYGGTLVIAPPFDLELMRRLWRIIEAHGVHYFSSVPTMARLLMQHAAKQPVDCPTSMRFVTCASAPLAAQEAVDFERMFGIPLLNCYGLTETSGWSACSPRDPQRSITSVGKALHGEIRIVGPDGQALPAGHHGEVQVKSPSVMSGYYLDSAQSGQVLRDGWLSTGDIGELDEAGALMLHARIKDLIIRAGKNVFPAEVDTVLMSHPEVADACTVGLPDALLGETVASCVVLRAGASLTGTALMSHARQKLAAYKCPQRIVFVQALPRTSRGKVSRASLRPLFADATAS
ncbi:class I adenylate-forming enzyme family protein [Piscinibacter sp.]|uniref:class I adenylate-forming enzyme family protein n=1 Tax=Piscinibacter sp. TaxID=1903157 RepID=UPI002C9FD33F|nr:class I adenylate-forming enzyme family protein [Albitalea sp.]HUG23691.1 class I adenylate-forming enzyme family protein [Albitalea sp.]